MGSFRLSLTAAAWAALILSTGCARTPLGAPVSAELRSAGPPPPPDCRLWPLSPNFYAAGVVPFAGGVTVLGGTCDAEGCNGVALLVTRGGGMRRLVLDESLWPQSVVQRGDGDALVLLGDHRVERMLIDRDGVHERQRLVEGSDPSTTMHTISSDGTGAFATAGYERSSDFLESPAIWTFAADGRSREVWSAAPDVVARLDGVLALDGGAVVAWGWADAPDPEPSGNFVPTDPVLVVLDKRLTVGRDAVGLGRFTGAVRMPGGALLLGQTTDFSEGRAVTLPVDSAGEVGAAVPLPEPSDGARAIYVGGQPNGGGLILVGSDSAEYEGEVAIAVGINRNGQVAWSRRFPDRVRSVATFVAAIPEGPLAVLVESTSGCCYDVESDSAASLAWLNPDGTCAD